ncbi:MAG: hypothetical protein HOP23_06080 [Methylococcaceae bacterium]|nr:hypothetical protein [Methylococcaceae bacterium]
MKKLLLTVLLLTCSTLLTAAPRISHHGERILKCHKPLFFDVVPADNSKVAQFQTFSFSTSANTDIATIKVWVNNQLIKVTSKKLASGRYLVSGQTDQPIIEDKAWIRVVSESSDGCNGFQVWNIFIQ